MRIALIQVPCWGILCPPYGLAVLSSYLKSKGHQVYSKDLNIEFFHEKKGDYLEHWNPENHLWWIDTHLVSNFIFDHELSINKKIEQILSLNTRMVCFSVHFSSVHMAKEIARRIKLKDPQKIIVFGGPQASRVNSGLELAALDYVDFVVEGEGEAALEEICQRLEKNETILDCPGVFLKKNGKAVDCGDRPLLPDLNILPFADFDDFDFSKYSEPGRLPISLSRGCPNKCIFCNERPYWRNYRIRKAQNVFAEIKYQMAKVPGLTNLNFHDSLVNGNARELEKLCDLIIADGLVLRWSGQAVISKEMTPELLRKIKKSGCSCLNYGLEIGSPELMQKIGKVLARGADIDSIVRETHNAGMDCILNFMFGLPGETEEYFTQTLDFLERNKEYIDMVNPSPGFCAFDKGSYGYEHPEELGIVLGESGALWESKDGLNNYASRLEKFERFLKKIDALGIKSFYPHRELQAKNTVLGHYYYTKRQWDQAIFHLREAVRLQPKDESNWVYLARSQALKGEIDSAKESFEEVMKIKLRKDQLPGALAVFKEARRYGVRVSKPELLTLGGVSPG